MKIYGISGLGTDSRMFDLLEIGQEIVPLDWIKPLPAESLPDYSRRLAQKIDPSEDFVLIGLSFGGLVGVEISKFLSPRRLILISSAENRQELPKIYRFAGRLGLGRLLPVRLLQPPLFLAKFIFGTTETGRLGEALSGLDPEFSSWAIRRFLEWKTEGSRPEVVKIHGTKDRLIPLAKDGKSIQIEGGGHFIVVDRAQELSPIIRRLIDDI